MSEAKEELSDWQKEVLSKLDLRGEVIKKVTFEEHMDSFFILEFESGKSLRIRYDWIYDFEYDGEEIGHY